MKDMIKKFLETEPSDDEIESFYLKQVLPFDKRSINEILND